MELILWRHAHAESGFPDSERELSTRGHEEALDAAQWLNNHLPTSCRILVSPARRTQQTAATLARPYETLEALSTHSNVDLLLTTINWPKEKGVTLVIGHQPTLGETAACLLGESRWIPKTASLCWMKALETPVKAPITQRRPVQAALVAIFTP